MGSVTRETDALGTRHTDVAAEQMPRRVPKCTSSDTQERVPCIHFTIASVTV